MTYTPPVLKLNTSFNAQTVSRGITTNRSGMASLVRNSGGIGANLLRTPSNPIGRFSRYANSRLISRMGNRPAGQVRGLPVVSGSYTREINFQPSSNSVNIGSVLGTLTGMVLPNILGKFGGIKASVTSQGDNLTSQLDNSLGKMSYTVPVSNDISGVISSMTDAKDYASLSAAITGAETNLGQLKTKQGVYEEEAANEASTLSQMQAQTEGLEKALKEAGSMANQQEQAVEAQTISRDRAKAEANQIDTRYGAAVDKYSKAHDDHINALEAKDGAQAQVSRADSALQTAKSNTKSAQSSFADAKKAYDTCPRTRINPSTQAQEPNEPQLSQAKAKMDIAQAKLREAEIAERNAQDCKNEADNKLQLAEKNVEATDTQEQDALKAKNEIADSLKNKKEQIKNFEDKLKKEQDKLDAAKGRVENAREKHADAAQALDIHKQKMESLQSATKLAKTTKTNIDGLNKSIIEQKARLAELAKDNNTKETDNTETGNTGNASTINTGSEKKTTIPDAAGGTLT